MQQRGFSVIPFYILSDDVWAERIMDNPSSNERVILIRWTQSRREPPLHQGKAALILVNVVERPPRF